MSYDMHVSRLWAQSLIELKEVKEKYPNLMRNDLPHSFDCNSQNEEDRKKPFVRILPGTFNVDIVNHYKEANGCSVDIRCSLSDGNDLPTGLGISVLTQFVTKYCPSNARVINCKIQMPKSIWISYVVCCSCERLVFHLPLQTPKVEVLEETLRRVQLQV